MATGDLDALDGLIRGADGLARCWWPGADPLYVAYHDTEWGHRIWNNVSGNDPAVGLSQSPSRFDVFQVADLHNIRSHRSSIRWN